MVQKTVIACAKALENLGYNIAFVESATAGRMCAEFALTPSSGAILRGGISCYDIFVKEQFLHIPRNIIEKYSAESAEVSALLAKSGAKLFNSNVSVSVTGLATPGGSESPAKPVGSMFIHILFKNKEIAHQEVFTGSPESIVLQTIERTATLILNEAKNSATNK